LNGPMNSKKFWFCSTEISIHSGYLSNLEARRTLGPSN
jgi:hypothetical protein